MILASLLSLAIAIYCYAISQLAQHGKLKWSTMFTGFWDQRSWNRKYKWDAAGGMIQAPDNWYYRFFNIKYKEAFPLSATLLVNFTDSYHHMQFWFFNFLSLSIVLAIGWNLWLFLGVMIGTRVVHWSARKVLGK